MNKNPICPICNNKNIKEIFKSNHHPFFEGVKSKPSKKIKFFPLSIKQCHNCGFVFQKLTTKTSKKIESFYQSKISMTSAPINKSEHTSKIAKNFIKIIEKFISRNKKMKILEIGCREGSILGYLRKKYHPQKIVGIDSSSVKTYQDEFGPLNIIRDSFPSKKIKGSFNIIYTKAVLEHIEKINYFIFNICKHLEKNGVFIAQIPKFENSLEKGNIGLFIYEHLNYFTKNNLVYLLEKNNLKPKIIFENNISITIICKKTDKINKIIPHKKMFSLKKFLSTINKFKRILKEKEIGFYGASPELFNYLYTIIGDKKTKYFIYDSDPYKINLYFGKNEIPIKGPNEITNKKIVAMPYTYAKQIKNEIKKEKPFIKVINMWPEK